MSNAVMQIRPPNGNGAPYAPFRDLVNAFPQMARRASYLLADEYREPWFKSYLKLTGTTDEELGQAVKALAQFINKSLDATLKDPQDCAKASGFLDVPPPAQIAALAKLGQVALAMYNSCVRDAMRADEKPTGLDELMAAADEILQTLTKPKPKAKPTSTKNKPRSIRL